MIADDLKREMARVGEVVMPYYSRIGVAAIGPLVMMRKTLDRANRFLEQGDELEMERSLRDLREFDI